MTKFLQIEQDVSVQDAAVLMDKNKTGSALVVKEGKPVGIITERDFLRKVVAKGLCTTDLALSKVMSSPILTIKVDEKLKDASLLMSAENIRRLAVVNEKGEIVGKVTAHGISRGLGFQKLKKAFLTKPRNHYAGNVR
jgi:CBS domain-containing protein